MKFFGKKKKKTIDLTGDYSKQKEREKRIKADLEKIQSHQNSSLSKNNDSVNETTGFLGGLANMGSQNQKTETYSNTSQSQSSQPMDIDERRRKLTKRLLDMTEKIEDISNQIYHLQQRIEVLEKKNKHDFSNT